MQEVKFSNHAILVKKQGWYNYDDIVALIKKCFILYCEIKIVCNLSKIFNIKSAATTFNQSHIVYSWYKLLKSHLDIMQMVLTGYGQS